MNNVTRSKSYIYLLYSEVLFTIVYNYHRSFYAYDIECIIKFGIWTYC